ncbi:ATP-binding cassette domain-containing protein [Kribbella sp. NBC_00709]|uniref:ABC transporter ATP-binding protein n=1 Tax=Kribbella sp. NBC_00709 TaxID=2975972 RepID=UPI002E28D861|nr:ATP-binding cassette domain-containing protein [Kribbella sp. NBC_00709]
MTALAVEGLSVRYGSRRHDAPAVDTVTLEVSAGGSLGVVGESGSGKSTLARAMVGLLPSCAGRIVLDGRPVGPGRAELARLRSAVQLVFQDPSSSMNPRMRIGDAIMEAVLANGRTTSAAARARTAELLDLVSLDASVAVRLPVSLSGGQCQRAAIARALATSPRFLIADEITSALDVSVQGSVLNVLRDVQRELGIGLMFISHNLPVVRYMSERIAVMFAGRVVESGPTDALIAAPQHPYTRELLAAENPGMLRVGRP